MTGLAREARRASRSAARSGTTHTRARAPCTRSRRDPSTRADGRDRAWFRRAHGPELPPRLPTAGARRRARRRGGCSPRCRSCRRRRPGRRSRPPCSARRRAARAGRRASRRRRSGPPTPTTSAPGAGSRGDPTPRSRPPARGRGRRGVREPGHERGPGVDARAPPASGGASLRRRAPPTGHASPATAGRGAPRARTSARARARHGAGVVGVAVVVVGALLTPTVNTMLLPGATRVPGSATGASTSPALPGRRVLFDHGRREVRVR